VDGSDVVEAGLLQRNNYVVKLALRVNDAQQLA
jgi:hypothetical protein